MDRGIHGYVVNLRETQQTSKLNINSLKINVNDILLVFYEKVPRHFWRIAIVTRVLPSRDSEIRGAILRIAKTNTILTFALRTFALHISHLEIYMTLIKQIRQGKKSLDFEHNKY